MAQTVAPAAPPFAWTLRLYDAIPLAPGWVGAMLGVGLCALFLVVEVALGRTAFLREADLFGTSGQALLTGLLCALLAYLCTVTITAARQGPQAVSRLRHLLEGSDRELDALKLDAARRPRGKLLLAGLGGVLIALLVPFLETGSEAWNPYDWRLWSPESTWHRFLAPLIGWWMGRLFAVMLIDSRAHSELARHIRTIDLLNLRCPRRDQNCSRLPPG